MELRNLRTFIQVCENHSFSKAAANLGYTQSTVTAQISQLEKELGVSLLDRRGKTFQLNEKGRELLEYAHRITTLADEAAFQLADDRMPRGTLRLGVIESIGSYFLPPILEAYLRRYPEVKVEVVTSKTLVIMEHLRHNQVDLILTLDEPIYDPDWILCYKKKEPIVFLCSPQHPFAGRRSLPFARVIQEPFILTEKLCNYRLTFEKFCAEQHVTPISPLEIGNTATILDFVEKDLGLTFLPEVTTRDAVSSGKLAVFTIKELEISMLIQLFYKKSKWNTPAMRAFEELVMKF